MDIYIEVLEGQPTFIPVETRMSLESNFPPQHYMVHLRTNNAQPLLEKIENAKLSKEVPYLLWANGTRRVNIAQGMETEFEGQPVLSLLVEDYSYSALF